MYGAICAAPALVLHTHGLLDGAVTAYPGFEKTLPAADFKEDRVVVSASGKCVTSRGPGTALEMGVKLVELLRGKEVASGVAKDLLLA